jgi:hypothetical protein
MFDLEEANSERRSTRMFLPDKAVPRALVDEALELASRGALCWCRARHATAWWQPCWTRRNTSRRRSSGT